MNKQLDLLWGSEKSDSVDISQRISYLFRLPVPGMVGGNQLLGKRIMSSISSAQTFQCAPGIDTWPEESPPRSLV